MNAAVRPGREGEPAVIADGIARRFGRIVALRGVSLRVPARSIHGLLGPNGAGKSTLFRILTGQIRPDAGTALVVGLDPRADAAEVRRHIGVVDDIQNLYPRFSVRENLRLFCSLYGARAARAEALLERFGLAERAGDRAETLSHGMRQKVLLTRALLHEPDILFLDEPTAGLDPNWTLELHRLILEAREHGATVVLATHQMETAEALCDALSIIDRGSLVAAGTPRELKLRYGRRVLRIERAAASMTGGLVSEEVPLDAPGSGGLIAAASADPSVVAMHTAEATLADVFRAITGRPLDETA